MTKAISRFNRSERRIAKKQAVDVFSSQPGVSDDKVAEIVGVTRQTIVNWRKDIDFIDECYDRFMEISGHYMPQVVMAMVREALEGNVRAAELILKHYGKFEDKITLKIESPFMQHLRSSEIKTLDAEIIEESKEIYEEEFEKLPEQVPQDSEKWSLVEENRKLKTILTTAQKNKRRAELEKIRRRAKVVGMVPMGRGRQSKTARAEYMQKLEQMERDQGSKPPSP